MKRTTITKKTGFCEIGFILANARPAYKKSAYSLGGNDTQIDFVLVGKEKRKYLRDVKVIQGELQHRLVAVDVEERKSKKSVKKNKRVRWRVWKLKEKEIKEKFEERIRKLVDIDSKDLWGSYKNGVFTGW